MFVRNVTFSYGDFCQKLWWPIKVGGRNPFVLFSVSNYNGSCSLIREFDEDDGDVVFSVVESPNHQNLTIHLTGFYLGNATTGDRLGDGN